MFRTSCLLVQGTVAQADVDHSLLALRPEDRSRSSPSMNRIATKNGRPRPFQAQTVNRDHTRMLEPPGHLHLQQKPLANVRVVGEPFLKLLDRHLAVPKSQSSATLTRPIPPSA